MHLSFKASALELNELHLTFNNVIKTISIAKIEIKKGEEN